MFSKLSRYRTVPDVAAPDARGRVLAGKDFRPLPEVTGDFTHTVDSGDRLDQLAATYYGQPLHYWRVCDANPDFLSPLDLLDRGPAATASFPLTAPAGGPPWAALLAALAAARGVESVRVSETVVLVPERGTAGGEPVTLWTERFERAVLITYNPVDTGTRTLADTIAAQGFTVGPPTDRGRLGKPIVVPTAVGG